ncbi:MAG: polysaccharide deacetylase family protein [bacterium]|nr:polysaccharide deacetylase family protein [bacterium]
MNRLTLNIIFIICLLLANGHISARELAITIDDLPLVHQSIHPKEKEIKIFNKVLQILAKYNIKATGFVVGVKLRKPYHHQLLDSFVSAGHTIGNHSYNHPDLNHTPVDKYIENIQHCDNLISKWINGPKYFRYPLLHRGDIPEKRDAVHDFLIKNGYTIASVTIDNDDYRYNSMLEKAEQNGDNNAMKNAGSEYLAHMKKQTLHFEDLAKKKLDREVKHILLIHLNYISALYLEQLLEWYKSEGWSFITLEHALQDKMHLLENTYYGKKGLSWIERIDGEKRREKKRK